MELSIQERLKDLRLSGDMIELLKNGRVDNSLLRELAAHPDFPLFMADLEIYVNGAAVKQVQTVSAMADAMSAAIMKQDSPLKGLLQTVDEAAGPDKFAVEVTAQMR